MSTTNQSLICPHSNLSLRTLLQSTGRVIYTGNRGYILRVIVLNAKLLVDNKEIGLNEFVEKFLSGMISGAVTSLRGVKEDWKKIEIIVEK